MDIGDQLPNKRSHLKASRYGSATNDDNDDIDPSPVSARTLFRHLCTLSRHTLCLPAPSRVPTEHHQMHRPRHSRGPASVHRITHGVLVASPLGQVDVFQVSLERR